jgi:hypothetical protein
MEHLNLTPFDIAIRQEDHLPWSATPLDYLDSQMDLGVFDITPTRRELLRKYYGIHVLKAQPRSARAH